MSLVTTTPPQLLRATNALEAGRVLRYHAAPTVQPQTVGHHSYGVAMIVMYLTDGQASAALLFAAINHDAAELYTGDVPFTTKRQHPAAKSLFDHLEEEAYDKHLMPMPPLTPQELAILKLGDTLEGLAWCVKTEAPGGPVTCRWMNAAATGVTKFSTVLGGPESPVILNALSFIKATSHPSNLYT